jgi:hypothetical protein
MSETAPEPDEPTEYTSAPIEGDTQDPEATE